MLTRVETQAPKRRTDAAMSPNCHRALWAARVHCAGVLTLYLSTSGVCVAGQAGARQQAAPSALSFKRFVDDGRTYPDAVTVVNGLEVKNPADWPTLLRAGFANSDGSLANCTGTLVGPRVVLTAAHCADAGKSHGEVRAAFLELSGVFIPMACRMNPGYAAAPLPADPKDPRSSADYALCLVSQDLSATPEMRTLEYEDIDSTTGVAVHAAVLVTGDGCASISVQAGKIVPGPYDFKLRVGDAIISTPVAQVGADADYLIWISRLADQPALCPGDSGGPLITGATASNPTHSRLVVAVNSSITAKGAGYTTLESRFAALATQDFRIFLASWAHSQGHPVVCGYNQGPGQWPCRR
jgi:trypsin